MYAGAEFGKFNQKSIIFLFQIKYKNNYNS